MNRPSQKTSTVLPKQTITLTLVGSQWLAVYSEPMAAKLRKMFGTDTIPTAFSELAEPERVKREIGELNPECEIKMVVAEELVGLFQEITRYLGEYGWDASSADGLITVRTKVAGVFFEFSQGEDYWEAVGYDKGVPWMRDEMALTATNQNALQIAQAINRSIDGGVMFSRRVVELLKQRYIGATLEFQGNVELGLSDGRGLVCGTSNAEWCFDLCDAKGNVMECFVTKVRSDDESEEALVALVEEIAEVYKQLNSLSPVGSLLREMAAHLQEGRDESKIYHKLAMLDGGIAQELIDRANQMLPEKLRVIQRRA